MKKLAVLFHSKVFVAVVLSVVAAVSVTTAVVLSNRNVSSDVYRMIKVFEMSGRTNVDRADVGSMTPYVGMNLENGDVLSTYEESSMRLSLDDDKFLLMEENTEIELSATGKEASAKTKITLRSGAVLNEILKPLSAEQSYEVSAPKATM
ncbi:MAG: hypothetical protein IKR73_06825, partial [Oscillospiraceae bacterium]|nr:hypothetical protein [Oscillospiraceae bacterium]